MPTNFTVVPVEAQGGERDSAERDAWRQEEEEDNRDRSCGERGERGGGGRSVGAAPRLRVRGSDAAGRSSGPRLSRGAPRRLLGRIRFLSVVGGVRSAYAGEAVRFGRG